MKLWPNPQRLAPPVTAADPWHDLRTRLRWAYPDRDPAESLDEGKHDVSLWRMFGR